MVPYDQPEAALVRRSRSSEPMKTLTCSVYPGHDYPMGQERPSGALMRSPISRVLNSMDTNDNIRASDSFRVFRVSRIPQMGLMGPRQLLSVGSRHSPNLWIPPMHALRVCP
jgi:hypothetical protein